MCTRISFTSKDGRVVTGRNMDWPEDMHTDLWAFAAGMHRTGDNGPAGFIWESTHSSVIAAGYNCGTADGINDAGLVANLLYLSESEVGEPGDRPRLSIGAWAQYVLDCCSSVAEVVSTMESAPFAITTSALPNGSLASLHLAVSDASGDSAVFEFLHGDLTVHHSPEFRVMTNSPVYDQQLAIDAYWREIGGEIMLPGTSRAADRYVRASYHLGNLPVDVDDRAAAAGVLSVQRNVATPLGTAAPGAPEVSQTLWTSIADSTARRYYYQDTLSPDIVWVELDRLAFDTSAPSRRLNLQGHPIIHGEVSDRFEAADPFTFLGT